ncbi:MAG: hypothetical protein LJE59_08230 [Chromatiaceae bacterium]|nr:hypothetical protein [Chromatiaceae bacterium]
MSAKQRQHGFSRRHFTLCLWVLVVWLSAAPASGTQSVLVVLDKSKPAHQSVLKHFREAMHEDSANGLAPRIESRDVAQFDRATAESMPPDLIITIGARAAWRLSQQATAAPVLNIFLPRAAYLQLENAASPPRAAIFLDQPIARQFALAHLLLPTAKTAGILRADTQAATSETISETARPFGFSLNIVTIEDGDDPADAIRQVIGPSDVIIATFDRTAYKPATTKWLLYLAVQQHRPIIGFSYALLKAGALAAVFSTPEQIADHAAELVRDWLRTGTPPNGTFYPRYYHVGLNSPVAGQLGFTPPSETELTNKVRGVLGDPR